MASFLNITADQLDQAIGIAELTNNINQANGLSGSCETWSCAFAPDKSYFAWSCGRKKVILVPWDMNKNKPIRGSNHNDLPEIHQMQIQIHENKPPPKRGRNSGTKLTERVLDCGEIVWSLAFGSSIPHRRRSTRGEAIQYHRFNAGQDLVLAAGLNSGRIKTWDINTGEILHYLIDHQGVVRGLSFAPDGSLLLVSASRDKTLKVWDLKDDGNMVKTLVGHNKWVFDCAFSPDAKMLASVGSSKMVFLWNMENYTVIDKLKGHYNEVVSCEFSLDGAFLATASYDTRIILWDPHTGQKVKEFGHVFPAPSPVFAGGHNDTWVRDLSFSPDGCHLASIADDKYVRFWSLFNPKTPVCIATVSEGLCCQYSPDGTVLAAGTRNGNVKFFSASMQVQQLKHLCRLTIRKLAHNVPKIAQLEIPSSLKSYLKYQD